MTLLLHAGASPIDFDGLDALPTPPPTKTHIPIAHARVVDTLKYTLGYYGHQVVGEHYGLTADGMRYFGLLSLKSTYDGYGDTVAFRNSHDKRFPVGIGFGGHVFCCDNLSFIADHIIRRKHTVNARRDLPGLLGELVETLAAQREFQRHRFLVYQETPLSEVQADHIILSLFRRGVLNVQRVPTVIEQWSEPSYPEWGGTTAWRLFNAVTYALQGRVVEDSALTPRLHNVIDAAIDEYRHG